MIRLTIVALCAAWMGSAMAADAAPASAVPAATAAAASAVPVTASAAPAPAPSASAAEASPPVHTIPPEKRQGEDATKCLELGSNHEIAACAEKYR